MNCILVDDDEFARKTVKLLCEKVDYLNVLAEYPSALEAAEGLRHLDNVDLLFLDIHMPELNGFDFLKTMKNPPQVIFTTSDPSKAIEAFEVDALDYLIKPVELPRFLKAVERLKPRESSNGSAAAEVESTYEKDFFVNVDRRLTRITTAKIALVEAKGDYVLIKMDDNNQHIVRSTIKNIESRLSPKQFVKVHRSFVINVSKIVDIEDSGILINNQVVPISRSYKSDLLNRLNTL